MDSLHDLLCEDLYAALPELKPLAVTKIGPHGPELIWYFGI